jgi:diguanylate cyclase (GGDEF)-like protein
MSSAPKTLEELLALDKSELYEHLAELSEETSRLTDELASRTLERTQLNQIIHELTELSLRDPLTGLFNRRALLERMVAELARARRHGEPLCLLMVDIDHFKRVNDTYGHGVGDLVIAHVAKLLNRGRRASDIVSRYGGEELVLLLPHTPLEGALILAERLRLVVEASSYRTPSGRDRVTVSIGVSCFNQAMHEPSQLLEVADRALYQSKREGRNRVSVG